MKTKTTKIAALAKFLNVTESELDCSKYDDSSFEYDNSEYLVLTDEEADQKCKEEILESLWAFNADFLINHARLETTQRERDEIQKCIKEIQGKLCESANPLFKAILGANLDHFVQDATLADGRGHFLSQCDGEENEEGEFYIYRIN